MTPRILSPELQQQYAALRSLLQRAVWLAEKRADHEATTILRGRLTNLQAAALLVIVGEVKAGKSSFINALVHEDVCQVAPGPCTTGIQELVYGAERSVANLGRSWDRVYLPKEVLREATIVDTPGTNSIVRDHQTITENYIPQSDLVVFVFSAVNPHTKTAWELLTAIKKEWHRKMVFVLQQADRASAQELAINRAHVVQYARDRQVANPTVFTLSAKLELEMRPDSGFNEFRDYLRGAIEGGDVWRIKVEGAAHTIRVVMAKLLGDLRREKEAIAEECAFYRELLGKVKAREANAASLKTLILGKLSATYSGLVRDAEDEFAEGFKMKNLVRRAVPFRRKADLRAWLAELQAKFQEAVRRQVDIEGPRLAKGLFDEMQWMRDELTNGITQRQEHVREDVIMPDTAVRLKILGDLRSRFEHIPVGGEINVSSNVAEASDVRRFALAGSGMAVLGILVVALSAVPWFDVAGSIFAIIGIVLFASGLLWRRAAILNGFREGLRASRDQFQNRLESETSDIIEELFSDVRHALTDAVFRLEVRSSHLDAPLAATFQIGEAADEMVLRSQHAAVQARVAEA
jgi:GTPase SAR1 family protein